MRIVIAIKRVYHFACLERGACVCYYFLFHHLYWTNNSSICFIIHIVFKYTFIYTSRFNYMKLIFSYFVCVWFSLKAFQENTTILFTVTLQCWSLLSSRPDPANRCLFKDYLADFVLLILLKRFFLKCVCLCVSEWVSSMLSWRFDLVGWESVRYPEKYVHTPNLGSRYKLRNEYPQSYAILWEAIYFPWDHEYSLLCDLILYVSCEIK